MTIEHLKSVRFKDLTRFNGFELLAWDFNPRWAMRSSVSTQIEFTSSIIYSPNEKTLGPQTPGVSATTKL
jgi:hypothetical protein